MATFDPTRPPTIPTVRFPLLGLPYPNVTPFTHRDGITYTDQLEQLKTFVGRDLVPNVDSVIKGLITDVNQANADAEVVVNGVIVEMNTAVETAEASADYAESEAVRSTGQADRAVTEADRSAARATAAATSAGQASERATDARTSAESVRQVAVSAALYGIVGDGVADDGPALQRAMNATPDGGRLIIPAGRYRMSGTLTNTNADGSLKSVTVDMTGATLLKDGDGGRVITFSGEYDAPVPVVTLTQGTTDGLTSITATHAGAAQPWVRGDVVKLYSDDAIPGTRNETGGGGLTRSGQFATVLSVAAGSVTFLAVLDDPLTSNVRMARMRRVSCSIIGGTTDLTNTFVSNSKTGEMIGFISLINPSIVGHTVKRSGGQAMSMVSCYGYRIDNTNVLWAWDDSTTGRYGYGVNDNASHAGRVIGCNFGQVRHGFTDSNSTIAAASTNPGLYGRSRYWVVEGCTVDSATSTAFDTHLGGRGGTFSNCTAINSPGGFALRGRQHRIVNSRTIGCAIGIRLFSENGGGESWGHIINDVFVDGSTTSVLECAHNWGTGNPLLNTRETRGHIIRGLHAINTSGVWMSFLNIVASVADVSCKYVGAVEANAGLVKMQNTSITGDDWLFDLLGSGSAGTGAFLIDMTTSVDSELEVGSIRVTGFSNMVNKLARVIRNTAGANIRVGRLFTNYDIALKFNPVTTNSYMDFDGSFALNSPVSNYFTMNQAQLASRDELLALARTRKDTLTLEAAPTAAVTLEQLPPPHLRGARLTIVNTGSSVVTINNGATPRTALIGGAALALAPNQSVELVFTSGGLWKQTRAAA